MVHWKAILNPRSKRSKIINCCIIEKDFSAVKNAATTLNFYMLTLWLKPLMLVWRLTGHNLETNIKDVKRNWIEYPEVTKNQSCRKNWKQYRNGQVKHMEPRFYLWQKFYRPNKTCHPNKQIQTREHTSFFSFKTKAPIPTLWEAFAGRVFVVVGSQCTSIKYLGSAWWK